VEKGALFPTMAEAFPPSDFSKGFKRETAEVAEVPEQVNCKVPLFRTKTQGTVLYDRLHDERSA